MEKISFRPSNTTETVSFYVLEETRIGGISYILVTDAEEGDAQAYILKDISEAEEEEAVYEIVEDDSELMAVSRVFDEMLEDVDLEL